MQTNWIKEEYVKDLVSVIIPTYNRETLLVEAINSVSNQTYRPIECIVVDDGSTDNTKEKVTELIKNNNNVFTLKFIQQKNAGSQVARNKGTEASTGEFIQYLDSDDLLYPDKIKNQVCFLNKNKNCDGVWGDWKKGTIKNNEVVISMATDDLLKQFMSGGSANFSFLMRRNLIKDIGPWDISLKRNQEIDFQIRGILADGKYSHHPQICGLWRIHDSERIVNSTGIKELIFYYHKWENILTENGLFKESIRKSISYIYFSFVKSENKRSQNIYLLTEAIRLYPKIPFFNTKKMIALKNILGIKSSLILWLIWSKF